jgi:hypothetical protein
MKKIPLPVTLDVKVPANGRITGKLSVDVLDGDRNVVHSDLEDLRKESARGKLATRMATRLGVDPKRLGEQLEEAWIGVKNERNRAEKEAAERQAEKEAEAEAEPETVDERNKRLFAGMPKDARKEAKAYLLDPDMVDRIVQDLRAIGVAGEDGLIKLLYLTGVSRLLDEPLAVLVQGPSTVGKSHVINKVASLFPEEAVLSVTSLTANSWHYFEKDVLVHRLIVAGERSRKDDDDSAETTRALREMISSGKLVKAVPRKDEQGNLKTELVTQDGPIAFVESTTKDRIFAEDANRMISLYADERSSQTRSIIDMKAKKAAGKQNVDPEPIKQRHFAMQRKLRCHVVVIPFAERLGELFPDKHVEARRAFPRLLKVIEASALLHQYQRERDDQGRLIATRADYELAYELLSESLGRQLGGGLPTATKRFLKRLWRWQGGDAQASNTFTTTEAWRREKVVKSAVWGWLNELERAGLVKKVMPGRSRMPDVWKLLGDKCPDTKKLTTVGLPSVTEVFVSAKTQRMRSHQSHK